ncbi:MAG: PTS sugar transporter subunit IIA [Nitrospirae bacterium]|nr:PTS sugar transporter subunit IIA [Nitrospirota bacterium]MBI5696295.1 PTS sugar transporter subunit IIA [Nitrospirota bacterium]
MVGLVIVCHGNLGAELVRVAELIVGVQEGVATVSVGSVAEVDKARDEVAAAVKRVQAGDGVLILTDMFGGTPSNLSLSFLDEDKVEVLTGVNLPMLIKFANNRKEKGLKELIPIVREGGLKSIIVASDMLHQKAKR